METVVKKITLTDFKNYNPNINIKCLDEDDIGCWNKIPMDLIVTNNMLKRANLPFVKKTDSEGNEYTVLRYYDIKKVFLFFEEYERSTVYYRLINIKGEKKWVKSKKPESFDNKNIFISLPSVDDYECGIVIGVNELHEQYLTYTKNGSTVRLIEILLEDYFNNVETLVYDTPYINISLLINSNIMDCGEMLNNLQKWIPSKEYIMGDIVFHDNYYYVALNDNSSEEFNASNEWEILNFDTPLACDVSEKMVYSESKLNYFIPQRKTYDVNGNIVPFIVDKNDIVYLFYKYGYTNYIEINGITYVDMLKSVYLYYDDKWNEITAVTNDNDQTVNGMYKINNNISNNPTFIKFVYIINAQLNDEQIKDSTGVEYEEIRRCYVDKGTYNINGVNNEYNYLNVSELSTYSEENKLQISYAKIINTSTNDHFVSWDNEAQYERGDIVYDYLTNTYYKCISETTTTSSVDNENAWEALSFSNLIVDDRIFGTSYVDVDLPKISIDRGNYTAMERHYVLGEINSFDDLEKYRNNMFKL